MTARLPYVIVPVGDHWYEARDRASGEPVAYGRTREDCRREARRHYGISNLNAGRRER